MSKELDANCDGDSSSTDEFDNNKSFVKKVKSRVSGFIPSTLSKWFGNKVRQREDVEEDDEDAYGLQPPVKRAKKASSENSFELNCNSVPVPGQQHNSFSASMFREPVPGPSTLKTRKLILPTSNHYNQGHSEQLNGADSDSGESTSGYSSMPRIGSKEHVSDHPDKNNTQASLNKSAPINRSIFSTSITHERSLFNEPLISPPKSHNASLSSRRPSFNASAFGTSSFMDKTLSTRRIVSSPFYNGRIAYGGASAYNRNVMYSSPENSQSEAVEPKLLNENKTTTLSKTAKRILDTLEQYTSPVQDVRRIPTNRRQRPDSLIGKYVGANPYMVRDSPKVPSNKELQVPTTVDLLKMKERLQESTTAMREIASKSNSPLNTEQYSLRANDDDKLNANRNTNKIKTKVSAVRQKAVVNDEVAPDVNLPDVKLPISTLPSFNFSISSVKTAHGSGKADDSTSKSPLANTDHKPGEKISLNSTNSSSNLSNAQKSPPIPTINFKNPEVKPSPFSSTLQQSAKPIFGVPAPAQNKQVSSTKSDTTMEFKFSKPLVIAENNFKSIKAINNFKFSEPLIKKTLNGVNKDIDLKVTSVKKLPNSGFGEAFKLGADKWECGVCMVRNDNKAVSCVSCTTPKPAPTTTNGPIVTKEPAPTSSWGDKFKAPANSWECSSCLVRNDPSRKKCLACESPKTEEVSAVAPVTKVTDLDSFKKKESEWECSSCMVRNSSTTEKCVCCETAKSSTNQPSKIISDASKVQSSWGDKFKAPSNTWECPMCLVRNEVKSAKCVACESDRPGSVVVPKTFDGFMKKDSEWECTSCMVKNPNNKQKCVCCEAPKPCSVPVSTAAQIKEVPKFSFGIENGLINGHGFTFGIPADQNKKENKISTKSEVDESTASIFGASKPSTDTIPNTQFSFGVKPINGAKTVLANTTTTSELKTTEKAKEQDNTFSFGAPASKKRAADTETSSAPQEESKRSSLTVTQTPITVAPQTELKYMHLFGTPASKSPPKLTFGAPKTTAPAMSQAASTSATTPAFTFGSSALNKSAATTSSTSSTTTPVFSFGTSAAPSNDTKPAAIFNAGSNKPSTNGPVFNFSTSKPKTEANSLFNTSSTSTAKPVFGTSSATFGNSSSTSIGSADPTKSSPFAPSNNTNAFGNPTPVASTMSAPTFGGSQNQITFGVYSQSPAPLFGAPKADATASNTSGSLFGKPSTNGAFSFNAPKDSKPGFSFGNPSQLSSDVFADKPAQQFKFSEPNNTQGTNGGFNFGATNTSIPSFNADVKPTFNFSGGAAPTFSAETSKQQRVIKKAVRRTQR